MTLTKFLEFIKNNFQITKLNSHNLKILLMCLIQSLNAAIKLHEFSTTLLERTSNSLKSRMFSYKSNHSLAIFVQIPFGLLFFYNIGKICLLSSTLNFN